VLDTYNGLSQLTGEYQEHNGAVNTATSPEVQFTYSEMPGGQNNSRPASMTYPNGRRIDYVRNTGVDSNISRLSSIVDDNGGTTLEGYAYLGLGTIVQQARPQSNTELTYIQQTGETNLITDGGDQYTGLDRFGRVVDRNWAFISAPATSAERFQYGYDRAGNVLYQNNLLSPSQSELYRASSTSSGDSNTAYDPLGRITAFARGTLSSSGLNGTQLDTIASASRTQTWSLDALGNWTQVNTNGTPTNRTFNAQNQTSGITYDHNGNTTTDGATRCAPRSSPTTSPCGWNVRSAERPSAWPGLGSRSPSAMPAILSSSTTNRKSSSVWREASRKLAVDLVSPGQAEFVTCQLALWLATG
jgi:hypothetical protein